MRQAARITIGQAVADLKAEFPDVDIKESKIRHLENEGLVEPERTPSGYRKYSVRATWRSCATSSGRSASTTCR